MTNDNRNPLRSARAGAAAFLLLLLAAGAAFAISPGWTPGNQIIRRQQALRNSQIAVMDIFGQDYGRADFSSVTSEMEAHPEDPGNAAFMSIPLSLADVYLNRYEAGGSMMNLEQTVLILEWVVSSRPLWGGRDGTGSVVSYLDITLARLRAECDVGEFDSRIQALWQTTMTITADEADAVLAAGGGPCGPTLLLGACVDSILPYPAEDQALASRAALFAAASSFLSADPRAQVWAQSALSLAALFPASACRTTEIETILSQGALSKRLGGDPSADFDGVVRGTRVVQRSSSCSPSPAGYETAGPVDVVTAGDSLAAAIHDSQVVAFLLTERFLWQFPPGSQCAVEVED